ncbi:MAG: TonB-dependent receptor [Proteobacteria bacterium]|nr:TonB-dependent receptor [Pseudomonadota bacterium]
MKTSILFKAFVLVPAALACTTATAQDTTQTTQNAGSTTILEEILVTATRRGETDIQKTPIAVTAISSKDLDTVIPMDLGDVAALVPNFSAAKVTGFNAASFAIRGITQQSIIVYLDPAVGVTVDDMVIPNIQGQLLDTFDMESIEVLRGPQGTTFGKNTTGGVVNIRTKRPELGESFAEFRLRYGDYNDKKVTGGLNLPLGDTLAFRFAGSWRNFDGYEKNGATFGPVDPNGFFQIVPGLTGTSGQGDGSDANGTDYFTGRFKLLWEPSENFSALFQYEILRDDSDSPAANNLTPNDPTFVFALLGFIEDEGDPHDFAGLSNRDTELMLMTEGHRLDVDGVYLNLEWDLGNTILTSFTGYREQESRLPNAYAGEIITLFDATRDDDRETFQQEFRLTSNTDSSMSWVLGGFYQTNDVVFTVNQILSFLDFFGLGPPAGFFDTTPQVLSNSQDATTWAVFGDVNFDLSDQWSLGLGVRYTDEEKKWAGRHQIPIQSLGGGFDPNFTWRELGEPLEAANFERFPFGVVRDETSWDELTYRATVGYDASEDVFSYLTFSHGFRSGGYNDQLGTSGIPIDPDLLQAYDPETADSFELGLKTTVADGRLRMNTALFYVKYDDAIQSVVQTLTNAAGATFQETAFFNAAEMTVKGVEFEATWLVTPDFIIRGNVGYIDGKYDRFEIDTNRDGIIDQDLSDLDLTRTPEWQWFVDATYTQNLNQGTLAWNTSVSYEDDSIHTYSDVADEFTTVLDSKTLWNATLTYNAPGDKWWVRGYIKNITDEVYLVSAQPVANLWIFGYYGPPRTYGAEAGFRFDW